MRGYLTLKFKAMTPRQMIEAIITHYGILQNVHHDFQDRHGLIRKSNSVIASFLEDIVAAYVFDFFHDHDIPVEIWVDQIFSFGVNQKFKPDITIIDTRDGTFEIIGFIEVKDSANPFRWKNAAGNNNRSIEYINNRITKLATIKNEHDFTINYKNHDLDENIDIIIGENTKIDLVLISDQLFSLENHARLREYCDSAEVSPRLNLHILLSRMHPNPRINNQGVNAQDLLDILREDQILFESFDQRLAEIAQIA